MRQHRSNTASTRKNHNDIVAARAEVDHMFPQHEICTMQDVFCFAALANTITGTMYTDITSAFPVCSLKSMQYILLHMSMISMQSSAPWPLAQMHPWRLHSQK
jgi:hypothetical protein